MRTRKPQQIVSETAKEILRRQMYERIAQGNAIIEAELTAQQKRISHNSSTYRQR
ncbi:MAG: hypothetical protein AAF846_01695 [Chloroflexota bacterium]